MKELISSNVKKTENTQSCNIAATFQQGGRDIFSFQALFCNPA